MDTLSLSWEPNSGSGVLASRKRSQQPRTGIPDCPYGKHKKVFFIRKFFGCGFKLRQRLAFISKQKFAYVTFST